MTVSSITQELTEVQRREVLDTKQPLTFSLIKFLYSNVLLLSFLTRYELLTVLSMLTHPLSFPS